MNERIRELFEQHTVPNFGYELDVTRNERDEYFNPILEDHWQTFQEAAELIVREYIDIVAAGGEFASRPKLVEKLQEHFGIQE